jgi:diguanylate cyclase (GGDEF)-like protein
MRRQHSTLRAVARLDHLTGMANRTALEEALDEALVAASRPGGERVALIVLDLDGFKQINDTLGHDKGDLVLQEIARRMHANVFEYDTAARLGGDEFAVVLRNLREADDVATVAHRLREALIRPIDINGVPRFVGASLGAAAFPDHARSSADLLRAADSAMYHAKRGHEGVRVYNPGTAAGADVLQLAADLMTAVETDQLEMEFQPQFSVMSGEITGVESLARWNRPGHGSVPPAEFIPVAEQTGLIHSLTYLTLRRALDEVQAWRRLGCYVPVSVNLSAGMATDTTLPAQIGALLEERGLDASSLVLEITETTAIRDREGALEVLQRLRATGVRIELDDFGSGYASFAALEVLPLDAVKLDRGIVADRSPGSVRLLTATIEFARRLGLEVVAEGIEDAATLDVVRRLGCDTAQGYHLGRPTDPDSIRALLARSLPVASH